MKTAVVTGVSTGIGFGIAKVLIDNGFKVFGSVRKEADGARVKQQLGGAFEPLVFDVTDPKGISEAAEKVRASLNGETLTGLVNNAGVAVAGPLLHLPLADFRQQIEVNLIGQVAVIQAFAPLLGGDLALKGKPGRIVNISSVGGRNGSPFLAPYAASKFAIEGLSESLRRELTVLGIDVIVIAPGAVKSEIWGKAEQVDVTPYAKTVFASALNNIRSYMIKIGKNGLPPERIGKGVLDALTLAKPKVRYTITPDPFQNFLVNWLPKRMVDRLVTGQLGLKPVKRA